MRKKGPKPLHVATFNLSRNVEEKENKKRPREMLSCLGTKEFFVGGSITINRRTCRGVECRLCIKACPTNALFWKAGDIGVTEELCIYCGACVLSCIVDDCIRITRKRLTGEVETFGKPREFITQQGGVNTKKRLERIKEVFPGSEDYLRRRKKSGS